MDLDPYQILGVNPAASLIEIKAAYRALVKSHHPDAGGDNKRIILLNAAWELLRDPGKRKVYDSSYSSFDSLTNDFKRRSVRNARATNYASVVKNQAINEDDAINMWLKKVYIPIDKLLGQVINAFPLKLKALSADPYDDSLMEEFCNYLDQSRARLEKVNVMYRSTSVPSAAKGLGLGLYQCFSQVEDALIELERYTMGYVDNYLHDGEEMLRESKRLRIRLHKQRRKWKIQ